jgi:WhiB family transcriptional regulator, redox-sensing transcriptional regulator
MDETTGLLRTPAGHAPTSRRRNTTPGVDMAGHWVQRAACRGTGCRPFFPRGGASATAAKAVCVLCPVQAECLAYALQNPQLQGVWGGTSDAERRALRRRAA